MEEFVFLFLILVSGSVFGSAAYRMRFEETLPLTCTGIVAVMFGAGLLGQMAAGIWAVYMIGLLLFLLSIVHAVRRKALKDVCKRIFTPGFLLYVLMFVLLILMHFGRVASEWDEFSHWMDIVKVMVMYDDFGTHPLAASTFQSYPPGMVLFQYFVHETVSNNVNQGELVEWIGYFAYHLYAFSFMFPFVRQLKWKQIGAAVFFVLGVCLAPVVIFSNFLDSLYIDPFLGVVAGCGMAMLYMNRSSEIRNRLFVFACMFTLVMAKDAGMMFAIFLSVAMLADEMIQKGTYRQKAKNVLLIACGVAGAILLPKILWELHLTSRNAEKVFSQPVDIGILMNVLLGRNDSYRKSVLFNFLRALLVDETPMLNGSLYLTIPVICLLLFSGICWFHQKMRSLEINQQVPAAYQSKGEKAESVSQAAPVASSASKKAVILWIAAIQTCVYILGLCVIYMFKFSEYEAVILASFSRYCGIGLLAVLMLLSLMAFTYLLQNSTSWICMLLIAVSFAFLPGDSLLRFVNRSAVHSAVERQRPAKEAAAIAKAVIGEERAKVYIVAQGSNGFYYWMMKFNLRPCVFNEDGWSLSANGKLYETDIWTLTRSAQEWKNELKTYDYVLLLEINDSFVQDYSELFENPEDIGNQTFFRVDPQTGMMSLCSR